MGALTEAWDKYSNESSYYYAKDLMEKYHGGDLPKEVIDQFRGSSLPYAEIWYDLLRGKAKDEYYFYVPWSFSGCPDSIDEIMTLCEITDGVSCEIREATEKDFFLFRPEVIDGEMLIITNEAVYTPDVLNLIFGNVRIDDPDSVHGW